MTTKPIPTPNNGESESDFMNRCVSALVGEGYEQDQASAICIGQWDESNKIAKIKAKKYESLINNEIIKK